MGVTGTRTRPSAEAHLPAVGDHDEKHLIGRHLNTVQRTNTVGSDRPGATTTDGRSVIFGQEIGGRLEQLGELEMDITEEGDRSWPGRPFGDVSGRGGRRNTYRQRPSGSDPPRCEAGSRSPPAPGRRDRSSLWRWRHREASPVDDGAGADRLTGAECAPRRGRGGSLTGGLPASALEIIRVAGLNPPFGGLRPSTRRCTSSVSNGRRTTSRPAAVDHPLLAATTRPSAEPRRASTPGPTGSPQRLAADRRRDGRSRPPIPPPARLLPPGSPLARRGR